MIQQQPPRREFPTGRVRLTPKLVIFIVLLLLAVIFAAQNSQRVDLTLLFWDFRLRLVWALVIFGLVGVALGWIMALLLATRRL